MLLGTYMEMNMMAERKDMNFSHFANKMMMMMMKMYEVVIQFLRANFRENQFQF